MGVGYARGKGVRVGNTKVPKAAGKTGMGPSTDSVVVKVLKLGN